MGKKIQAMAKTFLVLLGVVACCYAEAENGMFSLGEPGQDVSVPTDSAKPLLKPEDEAELSAMEDKRDHLMALVEEMETASPLDELKEGQQLKEGQRLKGGQRLKEGQQLKDGQRPGPRQNHTKTSQERGRSGKQSSNKGITQENRPSSGRTYKGSCSESQCARFI